MQNVRADDSRLRDGKLLFVSLERNEKLREQQKKNQRVTKLQKAYSLPHISMLLPHSYCFCFFFMTNQYSSWFAEILFLSFQRWYDDKPSKFNSFASYLFKQIPLNQSIACIVDDEGIDRYFLIKTWSYRIEQPLNLRLLFIWLFPLTYSGCA